MFKAQDTDLKKGTLHVISHLTGNIVKTLMFFGVESVKKVNKSKGEK